MPEPGAPRIKGRRRVRLTQGSLVAKAYRKTEVHELFQCSNELNRRFQPLFEASELRITGVGGEGEARVVELAGAPFFVGTLYLPQSRAIEGQSHPLVEAFLAAAAQ